MLTKPNSLFLYIGIVAAITMAISDIILLGVPQAGWEGDISSFSSLAFVSMTRIKLGSLSGCAASFFICFGFWYLREMLAPLHSVWATVMFVSLSFYMIMGGAFHAGYYFAGAAIHHHDRELYSLFTAHLQLMSLIAGAGLVVGMAIYVYLLYAAQHSYPKWMMFANLLVWQGVFLGIFYLMPSPIGGFLKPAFINIATLAFFFQVFLVRSKQ